MATPTPDLGAAALAYAADGWVVFPCQTGGKAPATAHGFHDATTNAAQVAGWWQRNPYANVGLPLPVGCVVVDIDDHDALHRLAAEGVELPATVTAETPRGYHYWYTVPAGVTLRPGVGVLGDGVDLRAAGSYVIAPPSVVDGRVYRWRVALAVDSIAPLPGVLLDLLLDHATAPTSAPKFAHKNCNLLAFRRPAVDSLALLEYGAREGERNSEIFRACCALRSHGATAEILREYAEAVAARCTPPLPLDEARRCAASAARYPAGSEGAR